MHSQVYSAFARPKGRAALNLLDLKRQRRDKFPPFG